MSTKPGEYNLTEFCAITRLDVTTVHEMIVQGVVEPGRQDETWYFESADISRCIKAHRLSHELGLDLHGAALALELMERNARLKRRIAYLEHLLDRMT